jgi:hypothetical protein
LGCEFISLRREGGVEGLESLDLTFGMSFSCALAFEEISVRLDEVDLGELQTGVAARDEAIGVAGFDDLELLGVACGMLSVVLVFDEISVRLDGVDPGELQPGVAARGEALGVLGFSKAIDCRVSSGSESESESFLEDPTLSDLVVLLIIETESSMTETDRYVALRPILRFLLLRLLLVVDSPMELSSMSSGF